MSLIVTSIYKSVDFVHCHGHTHTHARTHTHTCTHAHTDIDECLLDDHNCTLTCVNTMGSFECSCGPGLRLAEDETTCEGM